MFPYIINLYFFVLSPFLHYLALGIKEAEKLLKRIISLGRNEQWNINILFAAVHITEAFPELGRNLASALGEIPAKSRKAPIIPIIADKKWAQDMLKQWKDRKSVV